MIAESHVVASDIPSPSLSTAFATVSDTPLVDVLAIEASTTKRPTIDMMPPEVLQLVLEEFAVNNFAGFWDDGELDREVSPGELWLAPMQLAAVCRDWRRIALTTPSLWNRIIVTMAPLFEARLDEYAAALEMQTGRACAHPMLLLLAIDYASPFPDQSNMAAFDRFIEAVKRIIERSTQATVVYFRKTDGMPPPDAVLRLRNLFETNASALTKVIMAMIDTFHGDEDEYEYGPPHLIEMPFARSVSSIKSLALAAIFPRVPDDMVLHCLQELEIEVDVLLTSSIIRLLEVSPRLQRFTLRTCLIEGHQWQEPLSHATLAFLQIHVKQLDQEAAMLVFCFPALKHVDIVFDGQGRSTYKRNLVMSVCKGTDKLEHLTIRYAKADELLANVLYGLGLRQLKTLELEGRILYAGFWEGLARNASAFPCLAEIRCSEMVRSSDNRGEEVRCKSRYKTVILTTSTRRHCESLLAALRMCILVGRRSTVRSPMLSHSDSRYRTTTRLRGDNFGLHSSRRRCTWTLRVIKTVFRDLPLFGLSSCLPLCPAFYLILKMIVGSHVVTSFIPSPGLGTAFATGSDTRVVDVLAVDAPTTKRRAIDRMPPELLQLVLEHFAIANFAGFWDDVRLDYKRNLSELGSAPMRLAAVCRDWRHIALTTPSLWNRIVVNLGFVFEARVDAYASALELQLNRACAQPMLLLLVVDFEHSIPERQDAATFDRFIEAVKPIIGRSAQIIVAYSKHTDAVLPSDAASRFHNLFKTDAVALERINMVLVGDEPDYRHHISLDMPFARSVASIKSFALVAIVPWWPDDTVFHCLQELDISFKVVPSGSIALHLLEASPQVQRLTMTIYSIARRHRNPISHTTLTFLRIQIQVLTREAALQDFCFPALKRVEIGFGVLALGEEIHSGYKRDLIRSICTSADKLEHLTIRNVQADEQLANVLSGVGLQQLKTLELEGWILYASFGDCLAMNVGAFPYLAEIRCSEMVRSSDGRGDEVSRTSWFKVQILTASDCRGWKSLFAASRPCMLVGCRSTVRSLMLSRKDFWYQSTESEQRRSHPSRPRRVGRGSNARSQHSRGMETPAHRA